MGKPKRESLQAQLDALAAEVARIAAIIDGAISAPNRTTGMLPQHAGPSLRGGRRSYSD